MEKVKLHNITVKDSTFKELLYLKNYMTIKLSAISNKEVGELLDSGRDIESLMKKYDFEPEVTFDVCLASIVDMIWHEQNSGEVAYIT